MVLIQIALSIKLSTSASFRSIQKILAIYALAMNLNIKEPSYVTILLWTKRLGLYQLEKKPERADDWIIILDESIEFGHDKLLVIYGIRSKNLPHNRALTYQDLTPFTIISGNKWTGELINKEIQKIKSTHGKILYAVADGGNAIRKALRLSKITHIYDITHKFAWFLKEIYKDDPEFIAYTKKMATMRGTLGLSTVSHILPPNQRVNSRFMNLDIISQWGMKVLNYLKRADQKERAYQELQWISQYGDFIKELAEINHVLGEIKHLLKTQGLTYKNLQKTRKILDTLKTDNERTRKLKEEIPDYLTHMYQSVPQIKNYLCTSDIIESSFGKYKNYINNNPMVGITNLSLSMGAFTSELEGQEIFTALENITTKNLKQWSQDNIGYTNLQRRRRLLR